MKNRYVLGVGLSDLVNKNTGHHVWDTAWNILTLKIIYLKFTFNWASCIPSGNPIWVAH